MKDTLQKAKTDFTASVAKYKKYRDAEAASLSVKQKEIERKRVSNTNYALERQEIMQHWSGLELLQAFRKHCKFIGGEGFDFSREPVMLLNQVAVDGIKSGKLSIAHLEGEGFAAALKAAKETLLLRGDFSDSIFDRDVVFFLGRHNKAKSAGGVAGGKSSRKCSRSGGKGGAA